MSNVVRGVVRTPVRTAISAAVAAPDPIAWMPLSSNLELIRGTGSATFTRSTTKTVTDKDDGLVKTVAIDVAGFEKEGVLIEGASTNLLLRSEEFDNAVWVKASGASITANTGVAPDGTSTADKISYDGTSNGRLAQAVTGTANANVTFSLYIKKLSTTPVFASDTDIRMTIFGAVVDTTDTNLGNLINSATVGDWIRYTEVAVVDGVGGSITSQLRCDVVADLEVWGAQVEELPFASSYIPTVSTTVTKALEDNSIDAGNILAPTADYSVCLTADALGFDSSGSQVLFNVDGETSRRIQWNTTTGAIEAIHGAVTSTSTSTFSAGDSVDICFVVDGTNQTLYINGVQEDQDAKGTVTGTATAIDIGHQGGINQAFSHISPLRIFDVALTAPQVAAL